MAATTDTNTPAYGWAQIVNNGLTYTVKPMQDRWLVLLNRNDQFGTLLAVLDTEREAIDYVYEQWGA